MYKITTPVVKKKTLIGSVDTETGLDKYRKQIYALENYLFRYLRRYPKIVMTQAEYDLITPINDTVYVIIENGEIKKIYKDMLAIFNSQNSGGSTPTPSDPIQDLVDEYKAYVTSQGGEFGVTDAALYAEYEDMVTKGEITNTGTNTKLVLNGGLWGYKMGAGTKIDYIYSLTKIGGNFFVWDTSGAIVTDLIGGKIQITTLSFFDLDYALNSFYVELKSLLHTYGTSRSEVFRALSTAILRLADGASNVVRRMVPAPDVTSGANFFSAVAADYKFNFNRSNVLGTEKLDLVCERNGSVEHTFAQTNFSIDMDSTTFSLSFHSSSDRVLNSFKFALQ